MTSLETRKGFMRSDEGLMGDWRPCCLARSRQEDQVRAQTHVHLLIRIQRCALNISSSSGFRNEDMVHCNVTFILSVDVTGSIMPWEPIQCCTYKRNGSSHNIAI